MSPNRRFYRPVPDYWWTPGQASPTRRRCRSVLHVSSRFAGLAKMARWPILPAIAAAAVIVAVCYGVLRSYGVESTPKLDSWKDRIARRLPVGAIEAAAGAALFLPWSLGPASVLVGLALISVGVFSSFHDWLAAAFYLPGGLFLLVAFYWLLEMPPRDGDDIEPAAIRFFLDTLCFS
jgi:hypothetical protein